MQFFLTCRGAEEEDCPDAASCRFNRLRLPTRCHIDELNHAVDIIACAIFGRHGGISSTSDAEAPHRFCCWSSTLLRRQVVRPRRLGGV